MSRVHIVAARRTAVGRRGGGLSGWHPADLSAVVIDSVVRGSDVPGGAIDDVLWGCVSQIGAQSTNVARTAALSAGLPESVPGTTIDRQCGSSQQAVQFAVQAILSGTQDLVVAGGVEVMSRVPLGSAVTVGRDNGLGEPYEGDHFRDRFGGVELNQFRGAELIARHWNLDRTELEHFAAQSHTRAGASINAGEFDRETVPVDGITADEGVRAEVSLEQMAQLSTLRQDGRITAATASQVSDGAAALLLASEDAVRRYALTPLATVHTVTVVGSDPVMMLTGPIAATKTALTRAQLDVNEIDTFEVNEAFAPVVLAWQQETGAPAERVNPQGGAIALGHPLGATGARLMTSMIHRMARDGLRYGLQTMCEGGGMANAIILEYT